MLKKNRKFLWLAVSLLLLFLLKISSFFATSYKDFDRLLGKGTHFWKKFSEDDVRDINLFKELYLKNYPGTLHTSHNRSIPKVFHYIWLGPKEFPSVSVAFVDTWVRHHPDWKFFLWTDDMGRLLPHPSMEKKDIAELSSSTLFPFIKKTENYGEMSDLLRYEILYRQGGVYLDHDIECFRSIDYLASSLDFFAGLEPPHQNKGIATRIFPCNALIGTRPFHPILKKTIDEVQSCWDRIETAFSGSDAESKTLKVFHRTFNSFTIGVKDKINEPGFSDILLPASFFYSHALENKRDVKRWKDKGLVLALHSCSGEWKPQDEMTLIISKANKEHDKRIRLQRKCDLLQRSLYITIVLSSLAIYFLIRKKRKSSYGV